MGLLYCRDMTASSNSFLGPFLAKRVESNLAGTVATNLLSDFRWLLIASSLATIAGAVGGGYAGNEVEKRTRSATTYQVRVRMEDGQTRNFPYNSQPNWRQGDRVRVVDGYLQPR